MKSKAPIKSTLKDVIYFDEDHRCSYWLNIVNPSTAKDFDKLYLEEIIDYLKSSSINCCKGGNLLDEIQKLKLPIGNSRYDTIIDFLHSYHQGSCKNSALDEHREFIEKLANKATCIPNADEKHFHTKEEREKAWLIHTTVIMINTIANSCKRHEEHKEWWEAENKKWKEAAANPLMGDMYDLGF